MRLASAAGIGLASAWAGIPGAPKSVVALPFILSTTLKLVAFSGSSRRASFTTRA